MLYIPVTELKDTRIGKGEYVILECNSEPPNIVELCDLVLSRGAKPVISIQHNGHSYLKCDKVQLGIPTAGIKLVSSFNYKIVEEFIFSRGIETDGVFLVNSQQIKDLTDSLIRSGVEPVVVDESKLELMIKESYGSMDFKTKIIKSVTKNDEQALRKIHSRCLASIRNNNLNDEYKDRLGDELGEYYRIGFIGTINDILMFKESWGSMILRGSANNSLVLFLLGVSVIDPIKYELPFIRFINPYKMFST